MIKEVAAMAKIESHNTLEKILENGIIAISRGNYGDTLLRAVDAAARGGIKAVEITFEQNLAPEIAGEALDKLVRRFGTVLAVGAGTVLTLEPVNYYAEKNRYWLCVFYYTEDYGEIIMRFELYENDRKTTATDYYEINKELYSRILLKFGQRV